MVDVLRSFELRGAAGGARAGEQGELWGEPGGFPVEKKVAPSRTETIEVAGRPIPRIHNELWTARQRQGHSLHEISYRACFKAELPAFFIERLTAKGDRVLDPFLGRGTTTIEAGLRGRVPVGSDLNPLCPLLVEPRLAPPRLPEIEERLAEIPWGKGEDAGIDLSMFYHPETLAKITALRRYLRERREAGREDSIDRWIRLVAINRLSGHSRGFFSVYTMPPNQAVGPEKQRELNARRGQEPPARDVAELVLRKSKSLLRSLREEQRARLRVAHARGTITEGPADRLAGVAEGSVALTVTSPPFVDVVDYARDNWLRCWFAEIDAEGVRERLTTPRKLDDWAGAMGAVLRELYRVTRIGGWVAFEVGEVRGGKLPLDEIVAPLGVEAGLDCVAIAVHTQEFTKTANCWGVANNSKGTNTNRVVLFRRRL
ncbi:MAG: DNA modification methylase [Gemmatimonadetes bacterium]|nr:DNA modification methylase [Gemmatimonadota bacterium]